MTSSRRTLVSASSHSARSRCESPSAAGLWASCGGQQHMLEPQVAAAGSPVPGQVHHHVVVRLTVRAGAEVAQHIMDLQPRWVQAHHPHMLIPQLTSEQLDYVLKFPSQFVPV